MTDLFAPLAFSSGHTMKNRFMLAPLTNQQSHDDGLLSREEHDWLVLRAKGGFGAVMSAAAYVQPGGKGFEGQFGVDESRFDQALASLASDIKAQDSLAILQLYHAGLRAVPGREIVGPSDDADTGGRAMTTAEVEDTIEAFILSAERAKRSGFDGIELHGAHSYILCQFLSAELNRRDDQFGGSLENRARPIRAVIDGIRARCGKNFNLGLRLSPERMQLQTGEMLELAGQLMSEDRLDYLDMSLWDCFKEAEEEQFKGKTLVELFAGVPRGNTKLGVAGQIRSGPSAQQALDQGADFVLIGRAAIAEHDFPEKVHSDAAHEMPAPPFSRDYLEKEGVSAPFLTYLDFFGFVEKADA
jgi:2,4-dienoyl-CoA reductase-like NADH-dependent reductase (Old Yellow Enzyme family)